MDTALQPLGHSPSNRFDSLVPRDLAKSEPVHLDLEDLFSILQIDPNDSLIALELARQLRASGRRHEAERVLCGIILIDYRFETLTALADIEYELEHYDSALDHYQQAVMVAPERPLALFEVFKQIGNIFVRKGFLDLAEDSYNKAYRLNDKSDALLVNFGTLAVQRQDWDLAVMRFREALALCPTNDKAWVGLAIGHKMKGDSELAWGNLEAALQYNPLNEAALTLVLDWGLRDGREAKTLESLRQYLIAGGWSEKFSLAFSWLSYKRGDHFLARLELERLLAVNPENEQALAFADQLRSTT